MGFELTDLPKEQSLKELAEKFREADPSAVESMLLLVRIAGDLNAIVDSFLSRYGISSGRFSILMLLYKAPDHRLSPSVLSSGVHCTRATITGLLDGLQEAGLVRREDDLEDRRGTSVKLTPKGTKLIDQILPDHLGRIAALMKPLSKADRKHLKDCLLKVRSNLGVFEN